MKTVKSLMVGMTGSIGVVGMPAILVRLIAQPDLSVNAVMTDSAHRFLNSSTVSEIIGSNVPHNYVDSKGSFINPAALMRDVDIYLLAPASATCLSWLASGNAANLVTGCYLNHAGPTLIAPVMNETMLLSPAVQRNIATLVADGCKILETRAGYSTAVGDIVSVGGLPDVNQILHEIRCRLDLLDREEVQPSS